MSENPKLKTDFYPANWCLSLAVSFWGLRRVKYSWIQHGWLNLLKTKKKKEKKTTNKWHEIFIWQRQTEFKIDFLFQATLQEPSQFTRFVVFFWRGDTVTFTGRTHSRLVHNPLTRMHLRIHICFHLSIGWRGDKPLDRHGDPSFKFIH